MATLLVYSVSDFTPFTKILSADVNARFNDIKSRFNWDGTTNTTGLGDDNIQSNTVSGGGLTRASKLKAGTADYVLINDNTGKISEEQYLARSRGGLEFAPTLTGNAGKAIVVNNGETAFELGSPAQSTLTQTLSSDVASITAGEAISANDAVCLGLHFDASNALEYRIFKCDTDLSNRKFGFLGFAISAAAVTPMIAQLDRGATSWTAGTATLKLNGRYYEQAFTTDNDTTMAALAAKLAADPDVQSASVVDAGSDDRYINVTSKGALRVNFTDFSSSGGGPTFSVSTTQAPVGAAVQVRIYGPMTGFTSLTPGSRYYLSGTAGAITAVPSDQDPRVVGHALSSTILYVNPSKMPYDFAQGTTMIRSHGSSAGDDDNAGTASVEHFNFISWSNGTSDSTSRFALHNGESQLNGRMVVVGGLDTTNAIVSAIRLYNKSSWASGFAPRTPRQSGAVAELNGYLFVQNGSSSGSYTNAEPSIQSWNGNSWSEEIVVTNTVVNRSGFTSKGAIWAVSGVTSAGAASTGFDTFNGISTVQLGAGLFADAGAQSAGNRSAGYKGQTYSRGLNTTYEWSGSSWGSSVSPGHTFNSSGANRSAGNVSAFYESQAISYMNGGSDTVSTSIATTKRFNGSAWLADTSSSLSRAGAAAGVI